MNLLSEYISSDEEAEPELEIKSKNVTNIELKPVNTNINPAPDVDITDLTLYKKELEKQNFESGYTIHNKKNHVTGYINVHTMNDYNFNQQLYTYNAYGFAQDPTDFTKDKMIGNLEKFNDDKNSKSVFTGSSRNQLDYKTKLKKSRLKYGDPAKGDFMGPWAIYQGEEIFKNLSGELTDEQKQILEEMEIKRLQKMDHENTSKNKILNVNNLLKPLVRTYFDFPFTARLRLPRQKRTRPSF